MLRGLRLSESATAAVRLAGFRRNTSLHSCYSKSLLGNFLPPSRRLCFQPCLSVCLFTGLLKNYADQVLVKFHGMVRDNRSDSEWHWSKVKATRGQNANKYRCCE